MSAARLAILAETLLATVAVGFSTPAPDRQYVSQGEPPWDCEQLTVHLIRKRPRLLNPTDAARCALVWTAGYQVVLLRCALTSDEDGTPPSAARLHEQNMALLVDGEELSTALTSAWAAGNFGGCRQVTLGNLEPFTPPVQGGLTGWRMTVEIDLT